MVNYIAVLVAAIAGMAIGMFWYSPVGFGKTWLKLVGLSKSDVKKLQKKQGKSSMVIAFVGSLITAGVLAYLAELIGIASTGELLKLGSWIWLGFIATVGMGSFLWEGKPKQLYYINMGYQLVSILVMAAVISLFG